MTQPWITLWDDVELCWKVVDSNDFEETIATVGKVAKYGAIPGNVKMITLAPQMYKFNINNCTAYNMGLLQWRVLFFV